MMSYLRVFVLFKVKSVICGVGYNNVRNRKQWFLSRNPCRLGFEGTTDN